MRSAVGRFRRGAGSLNRPCYTVQACSGLPIAGAPCTLKQVATELSITIPAGKECENLELMLPDIASAMCALRPLLA
jgi:hypothetical protein